MEDRTLVKCPRRNNCTPFTPVLFAIITSNKWRMLSNLTWRWHQNKSRIFQNIIFGFKELLFLIRFALSRDGCLSVPWVANQCTSHKQGQAQATWSSYAKWTCCLYQRKPDSSNGLLPQRWLGQEEIGHAFLVCELPKLSERPGPGSLKPEAVSCPTASEFLLSSLPSPRLPYGRNH